jgi:hypothetical protein
MLSANYADIHAQIVELLESSRGPPRVASIPS